jgi:hypothetical protein
MPNEMQAIGIVLGLIFMYFLPAFVAAWTKHRNVTAIFLINLFLGWTLIGWVVALVWAVSKPQVIVIDRQV